MKAPCTKCGEMFERSSKYCKLCDARWVLSKKAGPKTPFPGYKACPICSKLINSSDSRMHLIIKNPPSNISYHKSREKRLGFYHLDCWNKVVAPKIKKILDQNKKLTLETHLFQLSKKI